MANSAAQLLPAINNLRLGSVSDKAKSLWTEAWETLPREDQAHFDLSRQDLLTVLSDVQAETQRKKDLCIRKGWKINRRRNGEEIKLRHVLEKLSAWLGESIKVVDMTVTLDKSGHVAFPWACVKFILMVSTNDIDLFANIVEGIEYIASLITRYAIVEDLYLSASCQATPQLREAITKLYAAILKYLSRAKAYFDSNSLKRFGKSLVDMLRKSFDELQTSITEVDVEKWTRLVDSELQQMACRESLERDEHLQHMLQQLDQPIIQITADVSALHDKFNTGSGKTRLVSTVINQLTASSTSSTSPIAFFYCARSSAEPERAKPVEVLKAILRQLASSKPDVPIWEPVATEYEARKRKADDDCSKLKQLNVSDCTRLILQLTDHRPAVILVDALDECDEHLRHELLEALDEIVQRSTDIVKIFVSSRDDIDIKLHLEHAQNISVNADRNSADIARFVESEVERLISRRLLLDGNISSTLKAKIIETLNQKAQGMFRWVALSLETLQRNKFRHDFEQDLGKLPTELSGLYKIIHKQILESGAYGYRTAVTTLKWLLCAQRLMKTHEIIAAVSVELHEVNRSQPDLDEVSSDEDISGEDFEDYNEDKSVSRDDIIRLCRNLVVLDAEVDVFRFAHQSVQEYLQGLLEYNTTSTHIYAAEKCIDAYLSSTLQSSSRSAILKQYSRLKSYSRIYWPVHLKLVRSKMPPKLKRNVLQFMFYRSEISNAYSSWMSDILSAYRTKWALHYREQLNKESRLSDRIFAAAQSHPTTLGAICAFGFDQLWTSVEITDGFDWNQPSGNEGQTLLHIAAREGQKEVVKLLLAQKNVDVDPKDILDRTPLSYAASSGSKAVVKLLLKKGAELESKDIEGQTPLSSAAVNGHEAVVKLLLEKDAELESKDIDGWTPLSSAAVNGYEAVVKLLLEKGAELESKDNEDRTPLWWATKREHEAVVELLLEKGAELESKDYDSRTPLSWAAAEGHEEVVELLLEKGAEREPRDSFSQRISHYPVRRDYSPL